MRMFIQEVMIDCSDPAGLAEFWARLMNCRSGAVSDSLTVVAADPVRLSLQRVPESKQVKNRLHLDVQVTDADAAVQRAIRLGARPTGQQQLDDAGDGYVVMFDPEGNEFCFVVDNSGAWDRLATAALSRPSALPN